MCLPPSFHAVYPSTLANDSFGPGSQSSGGGDAPGSLGHGIIDLEAAREEVVSGNINTEVSQKFRVIDILLMLMKRSSMLRSVELITKLVGWRTRLHSCLCIAAY